MSEEKSLALIPEDMFGGQGLGRLWTTIPNDGSRESAAKIANAMDEAESLRDHMGEVLEIENVLLHDVTLEGENGEEIPAVRTVLIGADGTCYAAVSNGVISSLQKIFALVGVGPWTPPLKVVAKEVNTRKGRRTLRLKLAE